ncbi:hypothetical protein MSAN_01307100 [Mycena sanguinolenta]|uniref:Uncharacterized protein n=1 Tax=Mycena sanguinolenta TaxID=230812 RepID=A0A8H6YCC8_9AGAR|nr:hypothetical protein MSAN_01307100 [Mycena sanguinolenta]
MAVTAAHLVSTVTCFEETPSPPTRKARAAAPEGAPSQSRHRRAPPYGGTVPIEFAGVRCMFEGSVHLLDLLGTLLKTFHRGGIGNFNPNTAPLGPTRTSLSRSQSTGCGGYGNIASAPRNREWTYSTKEQEILRAHAQARSAAIPIGRGGYGNIAHARALAAQAQAAAGPRSQSVDPVAAPTSMSFSFPVLVPGYRFRRRPRLNGRDESASLSFVPRFCVFVFRFCDFVLRFCVFDTYPTRKSLMKRPDELSPPAPSLDLDVHEPSTFASQYAFSWHSVARALRSHSASTRVAGRSLTVEATGDGRRDLRGDTSRGTVFDDDDDNDDGDANVLTMTMTMPNV